jgi:muramoyltetrapeptide carboxypeptidase LdcA involved in peptidoglycan recycling
MLGVFEKISGFIFSRARDYSDEEKKELGKKIVSIIAEEFGRPDLPVVSNFDIGHTDPQLILPLGVKAEINCEDRKIKLIETWLK